MKINKIALMMAAGCAIVSTASADVTIYMNGSTAYRKSTFAALTTLFNGTTGTIDEIFLDETAR